MSITIKPFTGDNAKWDAFIATSRNGTIFHTRKFLVYHPEDRFTDASLMFLDGEKLVGVLPAAVKDKMLVSHPGASYGGLVVQPDTSVTESGAMLSALLEYAKEKKYAGISMLRLPPSSLQKQYSEDQQYWLYQQGYTLTRCEMDGAIDLAPLTLRLATLAQGQSEKANTSERVEAIIFETLTGKCRNMVRQAERAKITVKLSSDFEQFWDILEAVLKARHEVKPTHTVTEIKKLHELLPQGFRLLAAFDGKKMVGGIVLITINDKALYTLYMGQEYASQQHHPMHLLLTEAIKLGLKEGKRVLHLGVSTEDGGKKVNEGLFFFKESFGCRPVRRESFEIKF